jgi:CRP-like cAMP-binding protein
MQLPVNFMLAEIRLFDALDTQERNELGEWLTYKELKRGSVIYRQGSLGRSVCFVVDGELDVIHRSDVGDAKIATLSKGEAVGELGLIDGLTRSADVIASSDAAVLILSRKEFDKMVAEKPIIGFKVLQQLAKAMSKTLRDRSETLAQLRICGGPAPLYRV